MPESREPDPIHRTYVKSPTTLLRRLFPGSHTKLFAKLDSLQVSGSTKERTAASLLHGMMVRGELAVGGTVVESTSGNLGIALARQCALLDVSFVAVVDDRANGAACATMATFGATVDRVPVPADGNRLAARRERVRALLQEIPGAVTTNQYGNDDNPQVHERSTFPELLNALGEPPTHLFVAMSTTGTLLGCQRAIAKLGLDTALIGVDAVGSVLFGGEAGERKLPGLGAGVIPPLAHDARPTEVVRVEESDMILGCRLMARREGLLVGASTGAIVAAIGRRLGHIDAKTARLAMLVHDGGMPYLETVFDDDWVRANIDGGVGALASLEVPNPFSDR